MAQKAILVTSENQKRLSTTYNDDDATGVPIAIGYYLVAGFGDHLGYEMLSKANFNQLYTLGPEIRNGFYEAVKR